MSSSAMNMRLEDREAIRNVLYNYCRAIDRRDLALLEECYHADAVDQRPTFTGNGRDFCVYAMRQVSRALFSQHRMSNILIDLQEDRAFVESYVHAVHRFENEGQVLDFLHYGRYCDVFEMRAEKWKIFHRLHLPDGDSVVVVEEPPGRSSKPLKAHETLSYARGVAGSSDPSYLKFNIPQLRFDVRTSSGLFDTHTDNSPQDQPTPLP